MVKDKTSLIDKIQSAVAEYAYDYDDRDFTVSVNISVKDGWTKAEIKEEEL